MIGELAAHLWQSTLFGFAAWILTLAFRKNRAKVRYWLWLSASLKFFVPFSFLISLGGHLGWEPVARKVATPDISFAIERISQPFPGAFPFVSSAPGAVNWIPIAIAVVWTCGFAAIAVMRLRSWFRIRAAIRTSRRFEIPAAVEIRSSPGLLEPGVVGLLRPILLVPDGIVERLTAAQLEAVLAHELCHVRRRDNLFAAIHMAVEAMFWFHPLVWWIGARLVEERERACDEEVLCLGSEPQVYAEGIVNVCKLYVESPLACISGVTGANLKRRIEAIMNNRTAQGLNRAKKFLLASAGMAAVACPIVIGVVIGAGNVPAIRAQAPIAAPRIEQTAPPPAAGPGRGNARAATAPVDRSQNRRLLAMLFDFDVMTAEEQSRVRQSAIEFVRSKMQPDDLMTLMAAAHGKIAVVHDFTDDRTVLQSAILKLAAGEGNSFASGVGLRLSTIEAAAQFLSTIPGKKALIYFASGTERQGLADQAEVPRVIETAKRSNVALYVIDTAGTTPPQPAATYEGEPGVSGMPANTIAGLPGRHASFQISAERDRILSVPVDSLSGRVDIMGEILTRSNSGELGATVANVRDFVQASAGAYRANFKLEPGAYVCRLMVREQGTGRQYGETIYFEVK